MSNHPLERLSDLQWGSVFEWRDPSFFWVSSEMTSVRGVGEGQVGCSSPGRLALRYTYFAVVWEHLLCTHGKLGRKDITVSLLEGRSMTGWVTASGCFQPACCPGTPEWIPKITFRQSCSDTSLY